MSLLAEVEKGSGDILVNLTGISVAATEISIVIEVRDRESQRWGRRRISEQLTKAMSYRRANAAIYLSRFSDGLAQEIGDWAEGVCEQGS